MSLRKGMKVILPLVVIALAVVVAKDLIDSKPKRKKLEIREKIWQIDTIVANRQTLSPAITLYGHVESPEQLEASAPGAGIVEKVTVRTGATVKQGQILVTLDQRDFESLQIQSKSELQNIESQIEELKIKHRSNQLSLQTEKDLLQLAEEEVERMRKLKNQNLGSDTALNEARSTLGRQQLSLQSRQLEVDSFSAKLKILEAQHTRYKANLQDARLMIERSEVSAPFDAIISEVPVSVGDRVAIGQTLVSLYPIEGLEIRAHIPARYATDILVEIKRGETPQAQLVDSMDNLSFNLKRLAGDAKASGIDAYFQTGESSRKLRPGSLLRLSLSLPPQEDVFAVPFQAIYGNSRLYLFRDGRMQGVDTETVGQFYQANGKALLLVRSPSINNGDKIVVTHLPNAVSGLKVKTVNNDTAQ